VDAPKLETTFETNVNKDFLRKTYDGALIANWCAERGKPLKYLGLPAWKMLDIIEWQEHLDRFTTIEREENQQHLLFLKANVANVEHRLCALYGEFDQILLSGRDRYQKVPEWPYGLVNLDYFGGFIYPNMSRPKAIKKLIQNQAVYEESFMLIITQQLRDRDVANEKLGFLTDLRKYLHSGVVDASLHPSIDTVVDWYESGGIPDAARQALYMNYFLHDSGEAEHFDVRCRPAVIYAGSGGAWMIHFVTDFRYQSGSGHRAASDQSLVEVINLGLLEARDGGFAESRFVQPKLPVHKRKP
jgi:hypothetical protein